MDRDTHQTTSTESSRTAHRRDADTTLHGLKREHYSLPLEEHSTAAWANIEKQKPISMVHIPSDLDVELAREWVEENQK